MRPDHFFRMVEAYHYNEEKSWMPFRRLGSIISNMMRGEEDEPIKDNQIQWLSMIDKIESKEEFKIVPLSQEEIRQIKIRDGIIKE